MLDGWLSMRSRFRELLVRIEFGDDHTRCVSRLCDERAIRCGDERMSAVIRSGHRVGTAREITTSVERAHLRDEADAFGGFATLITGAENQIDLLGGEGGKVFREVEIEAGRETDADPLVFEDG